MKIKIIRFRYLNELVLNFSPGQLNLLQGDSGSGKSTTIEAIKWCLFGKMQHVYPHGSTGDDKLQTSVTIEFEELGGIIIHRSKPPDIITLTIPNGLNEPYKLTGATAESYIKKIMGSKKIWISSSYIAQGERSPLMILSNNEKLELLLESTFGEEYGDSGSIESSPDWFVDKVDNEISNCKIQTQNLINQYNAMYSTFVSKMNNISPLYQLWGKEPTKDEMDNLYQTIANSTLKLENLKRELTNSNQYEAKKELLSNSLESVNKRMSEIYDIGDKLKNDGLPFVITQIQEYILLKQSLEQLEQLRLTDPSKNVVFPSEFSSKTIDQLNESLMKNHRDLSEYHRCLKICQDQKIEYNKSIIDDIIAKAKNTVITQEKLKHDIDENKRRELTKNQLIQDVDFIRKSYNDKEEYIERHKQWWKDTCLKLGLNEISYDVNEMNKIVNFLSNQRSPHILQCPQCNINLELKQDRLYICNEKPFDKNFSQSIIVKLREIMSIMKQFEYEKQRMNDAAERLSKVLPPIEMPQTRILGDQELASLKTIIVIISNITYPGIIPDKLLEENKLISLAIETIKWRNNFQFMERKCSDLPGKEITLLFPKIINENILNLQNRITLIVDFESKSRSTIAEHGRLLSDLQKIPDFRPSNVISSEITSFEKEIKDFQTKYQAGLAVRELMEERQKLVLQQESITSLQNRETTLIRLKKFINEITNHALQEMVDQVNTAVNVIVNDLFSNGMGVQLKLFKQLKTSDKIKFEVNLCIVHRGLVYDSPNHLSGGEKDRLSLALTLALSRVSSSPVLFLDECMASINLTLRTMCLEAIKKYVPHKTIINICHEIVEGYHDNTIII